MGSRVIQDWVLVRAENDGEIVQARLNWLVVRPEDRVLRIEARRVDTDAKLYIETACGDGQAAWAVMEELEDPGADEPEPVYLSLDRAASLVRWRFKAGSTGTYAAMFRLIVEDEIGGALEPASGRDHRSSVLQPWVSILPRNNGTEHTVVQSADKWFDTTGMSRVALTMEVAHTGTNGRLRVETAPAMDVAWSEICTVSAAGTTTRYLLKDGGERAEARFQRLVRWSAWFESGVPVDALCFRISVSPNEVLAMRAGGDACLSCACASCAPGRLGLASSIRPPYPHMSPASNQAFRDVLAVNAETAAGISCARLKEMFDLFGRRPGPDGFELTPVGEDVLALAWDLGCAWARSFRSAGKLDPPDPPGGYRGPGPQPYRAYTRSAGERSDRTRRG